ncbi:hypothetical protein IWW34DRAFT_745181 [Fusarium oxysporum f. sp. albedinis]|nr:hypothetical protein IWW34DRAFT_745181 [Fusarium oxysporum f. sp. albedinis]KAJ0149279.1 Uncharacterized protein HZ326_8170 [Fusarium oxysporum f. sp. albedinis]KAK2482214.1 hypothetical protein H9L39_07853 [Fusarium oxysporum f. sp. albedinis]
MTQTTSQQTSHLFEKGNYHSLENSAVLAYGLQDVTTKDVQKACDVATETYAREILNWPNGLLDKRNIFKAEKHDKKLKNLDDFIQLFVDRLNNVFEASPPKDLPIYPHAFVVITENWSQNNANSTLVLAHKPKDRWMIQHCLVPIHVELGLAVGSLRFGDVTEADMLNQFSNYVHPFKIRQVHTQPHNTWSWSVLYLLSQLVSLVL